MVKEALYGAATTLEIDSAARISLPEHDRKKAHLDREVTVVGGDDRLVIWDRETYAARQAETEDILGLLRLRETPPWTRTRQQVR